MEHYYDVRHSLPPTSLKTSTTGLVGLKGDDGSTEMISIIIDEEGLLIMILSIPTFIIICLLIATTTATRLVLFWLLLGRDFGGLSS
jgi:hypothetical protein